MLQAWKYIVGKVERWIPEFESKYTVGNRERWMDGRVWKEL